MVGFTYHLSFQLCFSLLGMGEYMQRTLHKQLCSQKRGLEGKNGVEFWTYFPLIYRLDSFWVNSWFYPHPFTLPNCKHQCCLLPALSPVPHHEWMSRFHSIWLTSSWMGWEDGPKVCGLLWTPNNSGELGVLKVSGGRKMSRPGFQLYRAWDSL